MKVRNALIDDNGQKWEFTYDEATSYTRQDDAVIVGATTVTEFRYRQVGSDTWLELPPWADVAEAWKINLCLFTEDDETDELTFWPLVHDNTKEV